MHYDNTQVIIDLDAIQENFDTVSRKTQRKVMAVVKADAYGHGAVPVARLLEGRCGFFGVSSMLEALELRQAGIQTPILILGQTPPEHFPDAIALGIRPTIFDWPSAQALSQAAVAAGHTAPFHFAVDTGMSRLGFQVSEASADLCLKIAALPGLRAEGLFSHFATADCADLTRAQAQEARFSQFDQMLRRRGLTIPLRHMDNSAGLMNFSHPYEMVRSGIVTYGLYPSQEVSRELLPLIPALRWVSRVSYVKPLPPGREIGYGGTYLTQRDMVVATIPVGYADGYRWSLSGKFHVLIHGQKAPILGRICMDQLMVDVSAIPGVQSGDLVTLVGRDGENQITMEEIAAAAGSFPYEFICGISRRVPRVYVQKGKTVQSVRYLIDPTVGEGEIHGT